MSFATESTICRHSRNATAIPTEQELELSHLVRPGMTGGGRIKQILQPGKYAYEAAEDGQYLSVGPTMIDVAERRRDSVRLPRLVRLAVTSWRRYQELTWTAYLANISHQIIIPVSKADDATLGYYNCRLLKAGDIISLDHRSIVTDFIYQEDYFGRYVMGMLGGSLIEQHAFAHVDMPRDLHSGHLVIGKIDPRDQALELTAFAVSPGDSVYIPAGTIHTNDYLLGAWQTLLSSACEFPNARISQPGNRPLRFFIE